MTRARISPPRQTTAKGAKVVSAMLENADVFRTAKRRGETPGEPAVLVLRRRPDFDRKDFDRKARDLTRLSGDGKLKKATPERTTVLNKNKSPHRKQSLTNVYRERMIRRIDKNRSKYLANKSVYDKLQRGRQDITARGQGLDPDHIQELQLDGEDAYNNLRLMDSWTNRELGREIGQALRDVPAGTPIIVRVVP